MLSAMNKLGCTSAWLVSLLLAAVAVRAEPKVVGRTPLPVGSWIEDTLAQGEIASFPLSLAAGTFIRVEVRTIDIQANLRLIGPDQKTLRAGDQEFLFWITEAPGNYRLEVIGPARRRLPGRYAIALCASRPVETPDRLRLEAQRLDDEAASKDESQSALREKIEILNRVRGLWKEAGETAREADTVIDIASSERLLGKPGELIRALCDEARSLAQNAGNRYVEARALADKSRSLSESGYTQAAIDAKQEAAEIYGALGDPRDQQVVLTNLALNYKQVGDEARAVQLGRAALRYSQAAGEAWEEVQVAANFGNILVTFGQRTEGLTLIRSALETARREKLPPNVEGFASVQLGRAQFSLGQVPEAADTLEQALAIYQKIGNRWRQGSTRIALGAAYAALGQLESSHDLIVRGLLELRASGDRGGELQALYELAKVERAMGKLDEARQHLDEAIEIQETTRRELIREDWRSSYLATLRQTYELAVDLRMAAHRRKPRGGLDAEALSVSERARARTLVELLGSAGVDFERGADPELLKRRLEIETALKTQAEQQLRLVTGEHRPEQLIAAQAESERLTEQLRELEGKIRNRAATGSWAPPETVSANEIRQRLLDEDTTLLEYWFGSEHSYVWVVTSSSIQAHQLPPRKQVEKVARRTYAQLKSPSGTVDATKSLSQMLLRPVAQQLKGKRLVIVADGVLQYIPFGALRLSDGSPVVSRFTVAYQPSASALSVIREEGRNRQPAAKQAAVFADPVYDKRDPRVSGVLVAARTSGELTRSVEESGLVELNRLPGTRTEAAILRQLTGGDGLLEAVGFDANRKTVFKKDLASYRILHFATHGLVNSVHPELSGLVLSLVDRDGRPQDGFLQAHEIYQLKLGADLAVLSACQTALGKEIRGEGLIGLTRAFIAAGVPRVVASLWSVPDAATAELMRRFYRGILKEGLPAAAALRQAQDSLRKERRWSAPYFWAGFILQGDWA